MKRYADVDDIAARYLELAESRASLPAINLVAASGVYCLLCGTGAPTQIKVGNAEKAGRWSWVIICSNCREPWEGAAMELMKRHVQPGARTNLTEVIVGRSIDEFRVLASCVEERPEKDVRGRPISIRRWEHGVVAWLAYSQSQWGTYARVIEFGREHRPDMSDLWTEKRVRSGITRVREVVRSRAISAGVLR